LANLDAQTVALETDHICQVVPDRLVAQPDERRAGPGRPAAPDVIGGDVPALSKVSGRKKHYVLTSSVYLNVLPFY